MPGQDGAATTLLVTKLHIPALRPQLVPRPRLVEQVQAGLRGKLTIVSAPAGFGKTTLLSAWRASTDGRATPLAWVSLDVDDNDPIRFWGYVIAALETVYPALNSDVGALLRSPQRPVIEIIVTSLINAIMPMKTNATLVLDDYHLIATPSIHTALAFLLDHLPPQLHLVMLTRADPPLPLMRLRSRGDLTELRAADLRFTIDEAAAFLTLMLKLPLTSAEVAALESRTEGWIAGLQLAALAMQNRNDYAGFVAAFSGSNRFVVDYLAEEVLNRLPAHLQTFVLRTSILDRLCGPLCDALLLGGELELDGGGQAYSQVVLEELERANLFLVPLDDERRWYRYHHLFAEVLRARLHSGAIANDIASLHQRASAWYERADLIDEAVRSAFLGQDRERAADLIERYARTAMLRRSDVVLVRSWLKQVPRDRILARPQLTIVAGLALAFTADFAAVERLLLDAAPALHAPDLPANIIGELAQLRATMARFQGDVMRSLEYAQQALTSLAPDNYASRAGAFLNIGVAAIWRGNVAVAQTTLADAAALAERAGSFWLAQAALEELMSFQGRQGQLRQVVQTAAQAAQLSVRLAGQRLPSAGMGYVGSAEVLYEWNELPRAAEAGTVATDLLRGSVERLLLVRGYIALAQARQAQGDHTGALDAFERCETWFAQIQIEAPVSLAWLAAYRARLSIQVGDLAAAIRWTYGCAPTADQELQYVQQLTLVRVRLAQNNQGAGGLLLDEANTLLAQILPAVEALGWHRYLIEILILQALVDQEQGNQTSALTALQRALALAEPEGYVRLFVDAGPPLAALLALVAQHESPVARYAARLLEAFPRDEGRRMKDEEYVTSPPPSSFILHPLVEPLSEREIEIVRLIAAGRSNQEIADMLVIALSTVKKHINNLYGKLDVQSRTQALVRARELHLL